MIRILLAEDDAGDVLLVEQALDEHQIVYELFVVRDGAEALAFVANMGEPGHARCPDVVLLDLNLPKIDGPEVLRRFRKHPQCARTPVIVISSSDAPKDRTRMTELGIAHYFKKPSDFDEFLKLGGLVRDVAGTR